MNNRVPLQKRTTMKRIIAIFILLSSALLSNAQQEIMISQYMFNGLVLNPAYAGSHPYFGATLLHRSQWLKFDGAPTTQTFAIDGPVLNRRAGVGLTFSNDQIGVTKQQEIGLNFAGKVSTGRGRLALGLRVGGAFYSATLSDLVVFDANDPSYANNINSKFIPKVGAGIYYYERNWFAGVSMPVLFAADKAILPEVTVNEKFFKTHTYLNAGVVLEPSSVIAVKPSVLVKYQGEAPLEVDINCNVMFFQKFWLGAGYRTGDAVIFMAEWNITDQMRLGYAYDWTTTAIGDYSNGSHEVMLGFDFGKDVKIKVRSPRYF
jgi:type IX secretion system PorP/SprF family membrane protein